MSGVIVAFKRMLLLVLCLLVVVMPQSIIAAELEVVQFGVPSGEAFKLMIDAETQSVSLAELEGLGMRRVTTSSPWEEGMLTFEGPLLADVVSYLGLDDVPFIKLRAIDGFVAEIPRSDWLDAPVVLATRQDGKLLSRRNQGPTRVIFPLVDYPQLSNEIHKGRWIWLISSLEVSSQPSE